MIWERYFLRETLKIFTLCLGAFYFTYAALDYSTHMQDFLQDKKLLIADGFYYYFHQFIKRSCLLIPLSLLVATIKVLTTLNMRRELVALQAAGISLRRLLRPFFAIACLSTLFSYSILEFVFPKSAEYLDRFEERHFQHSYRGKRKEPMHILYLKDRSKLIYQSYDSGRAAFFDVLWIRSANDLWRIKYLNADPENPIGKYADHLMRNSAGELEKSESFDLCLFSQLKWHKDMTRSAFIPFENRKISELFRAVAEKKGTGSYLNNGAIAHLSAKCLLPLLPLLVVVASVPSCIGYGRMFPLFFIYAGGIFGFLAFFALVDAATILGENHVVNPLAIIPIPYFVCGALFTWRLAKKV